MDIMTPVAVDVVDLVAAEVDVGADGLAEVGDGLPGGVGNGLPGGVFAGVLAREEGANGLALEEVPIFWLERLKEMSVMVLIELENYWMEAYDLLVNLSS